MILRYNRAMERASRTLQRIMAEALRRLPPEDLPAAAWEFAAGRAVAEKTRLLECAAEVLTIEAPDATWRAQLEAMAPQFLARIHPFIPIKRVEFRIAPRPGRNSGVSEGKAKRSL